MFDYKTRLNHAQRLFTKSQFDRLVKNHKNPDQDHAPVVKLFGGGSCTWLLSELDPETGIAFGLCDLGMGSPELGPVSMEEIVALQFPPFRTCCERDLHFHGKHPMSHYSDKARAAQRITA